MSQSPPGSLSLLMYVEEQDADPTRVEQLGLALRRELLETGVNGITQVSKGQAPSGSRAWDAVSVGSMLVAITSSAWAVSEVINTVKNWVSRAGNDCSVKVTIGDRSLRLSGVSKDDERKLIDDFLVAALSFGSDPVGDD